MKRNINSTLRKIFAVYQIIGGLTGLWFAVSGGITLKVLHLLVLLAGLAFFSFSVYAGIILFVGTKKGFKNTLFVQLLQVLKIKVFGYGFGIYSGLKALVGFTDTPDFKLFFEFKLLYSSKFYIFPGQGSDEITLVFNVIPILIVIYVSNQMKKKTSPNTR